jgi:hypothetical protein
VGKFLKSRIEAERVPERIEAEESRGERHFAIGFKQMLNPGECGVDLAQMGAGHGQRLFVSRTIHGVVLDLFFDFHRVTIDCRLVVQESGRENEVAHDARSLVALRAELG